MQLMSHTQKSPQIASYPSKLPVSPEISSPHPISLAPAKSPIPGPTQARGLPPFRGPPSDASLCCPQPASFPLQTGPAEKMNVPENPRAFWQCHFYPSACWVPPALGIQGLPKTLICVLVTY